MRSFHYFLTKTAPVVAGVFFKEFWFQSIPKACQTNPALWHAVVSLGAVHEGYNARIKKGVTHTMENRQFMMENDQTQFALRQYSISVKYLINSIRSAQVTTGRQVALAASAIFVHICSMQGLQSQALVHLRSGLRLLEEAQADERKQGFPLNLAQNFPVSLPAVQSVLQDFNAQAAYCLSSNSAVRSDLFSGIVSYNYWRNYHCPVDIDPGAAQSRAEEIVDACRVIESLSNDMATFLDHPDIVQSLLNGEIAVVRRQQLQFRRMIQRIGPKIAALEDESEQHLNESEQDAVKMLRVLYILCQMLLVRDPMKPFADRTGQFSQILDLCSKVMAQNAQADFSVDLKLDSRDYMTLPSTTQSLFFVAVAASSPDLRQNALYLLNSHPRHDGFYDSLFIAKLASLVLKYKADFEASMTGKSVMERVRRHPRVIIELQDERNAKVILRDFDQWSAGTGGKEQLVEW